MPELKAYQRYATLNQMGVRLWVARKRLPRAAASTTCAWPKPAQKKIPSSSLSRPASTKPATTPKPRPIPPSTAVAAPLVQRVSMQPTQLAPPLQLDVWMLANRWQLVWERPIKANLTPEQLHLLQDIIRALYPGGLGMVSKHHFNWPLPGVPLDTGDDEELRLSIRAFLSGPQFNAIAVDQLVFGERLQQLLPEAQAAPAFIELLQQPQAKRDFWQRAGESGLRARFASSPLAFFS